MFPLETRILVIDDMRTVRDVVKKQLNGLGFTNISEATDGELGLNEIKSKNESGSPYQLVICDWNMPKMKGLELLKIIRSSKEFSALPFVILTSESDMVLVKEAISAGVSQYMLKPFSSSLFEEKLKAAWLKHNK